MSFLPGWHGVAMMQAPVAVLPVFKAVSTQVDRGGSPPFASAIPAGAAAGDYLVLIACGRSGAGGWGFNTTLSGWTFIGRQSNAVAFQKDLIAFGRIMQAGDTGPSVGANGAMNDGFTVIMAFSGAKQFESVQSGTEAATATPSYLVLNTLGPKRKVLQVIFGEDMSPNGFAPGGSWTERFDYRHAQEAGTVLTVDDQDFATAQTTPSGTLTGVGGTPYSKLAFALAS